MTELVTASNPETGETLVLIGNDWQKPEQTATNEEGQKAFLVGGKWHTTPGGAATGNPNIAAQGAGSPIVGQINPTDSRKSMMQGLKDIGGAAVGGAVAGAFTPEILTVLGAAAAPFPATAPMAPYLFGAGQAARGARLAGAGLGAVGGAVGETVGQGMELAGSPQWGAEVGRFVAGGFAPEVAKAIPYLIRRVGNSAMWRTTAELADEVIKRSGGKPEDLSAKQREVIEKEIEALRGGAKSDVPMRGVYEGLESGAQQAKVIAKEEADNILSLAERQARQEYDSALTGPIAAIKEKINRLSEIGGKIVGRAESQRGSIATDRELSDVGNELRSRIVTRNEAAITARKEQYKADEAARDSIVGAKENAGIYVESMPEYRQLLLDTKGKLLEGRKAREVAGNLKPVADPGTERAYQNMLSALQNKRVMVPEAEAKAAEESGLRVVKGTNPQTGEPAFYREFTNSFEALDHVRRKLGDVISGKPAEGYDAIGSNIAQKYYSQISEIQKNFAGGKDGPQAKLLRDYADATEGLSMFGSRTGKKATALDKFNDAEFATDSSALPKFYFKNKDGVQALRNLTGDPALVNKAASEYAANQLAGKSQDQVRSWMTTNREMLSELPEVRIAVSKYADTLQRAERHMERIDKYQKNLATRERLALGEAESTRAGTLAEAERGATQTIKFGEQVSKTLTGDSAPVARVRELIESGSKTQWEAAGAAIQDNPTARAQVFDAVRQVVADKASRGTKDIGQWYGENLRPFLEGSSLATKGQLDLVSQRLKSIEEMKLPEETKRKAWERILFQAVTAYSASAGARGVSAISGSQ